MKIALLGYGKMGKTIDALLQSQYPRHQIIMRSDSFADTTRHHDLLAQADAAIEFSTPDSVVDNIFACFEAGVPVVVGTTGWYRHLKAVQQRCENGGHALLYASNFSIGVNILFELNRRLAQLMSHQPQYTAAIEEIHHTEKLDAPSGTAITLAEDLLWGNPRYREWQNDDPFTNAADRRDDVLYIQSQRTDNAIGTHHIRYQSPIDRITLSHEAFSREGFAQGALIAAEWLYNKKGVFTMKDLLAQ